MTYPLLDSSVITATSGLMAIIVIAAALLRGWQYCRAGTLDRRRTGSGRC